MERRTPEGQLSLMFGHNDASLSEYLEAHTGMKVSLVLTENSTSMLSAKKSDGILHVRMHRMFMAAGSDVLNEIVLFLKKRRADMTCFRRFIRDNQGQSPKRPTRNVSVKTAGIFHNLKELFMEINEAYFDGKIESIITWGAGCPRRSVRKRTLGSYSAGSNIIRINPVLDRKSVPRYFVAFVVYHEMLHAAIGVARHGGRQVTHSREFRKRERLFRDYDRAMEWERKANN